MTIMMIDGTAPSGPLFGVFVFGGEIIQAVKRENAIERDEIHRITYGGAAWKILSYVFMYGVRYTLEKIYCKIKKVYHFLFFNKFIYVLSYKIFNLYDYIMNLLYVLMHL